MHHSPSELQAGGSTSTLFFCEDEADDEDESEDDDGDGAGDGKGDDDGDGEDGRQERDR